MMGRHLVIGFSGGRTSALMAEIIKKHSHYSEYEKTFYFCNTGREHQKTLDFVENVDRHLSLGLVWLEAVVDPEMGVGTGHRIISRETASIAGEPFEAVIAKYGIPSKKFRHCTRELKHRPIESYMRAIGVRKYLTAVGIRADEPHRLKARGSDCIYPLVDFLPVDKKFVRDHWRRKPFDLEVREQDGNCDGCFLKSLRKRLTIAQQNPERFDWWQRMEETYPDIKPRCDRFDQRDRLFVRDILARSNAGDFIPFEENTMLDGLDSMDWEEACECKST